MADTMRAWPAHSPAASDGPAQKGCPGGRRRRDHASRRRRGVVQHRDARRRCRRRRGPPPEGLRARRSRRRWRRATARGRRRRRPPQLRRPSARGRFGNTAALRAAGGKNANADLDGPPPTSEGAGGRGSDGQPRGAGRRELARGRESTRPGSETRICDVGPSTLTASGWPVRQG